VNKAREIDRYKLWYSVPNRARNEVGILVDKELVDLVAKVRQKSDRIMAIKVVVGSEILNVVRVYAPQIGWVEDIKKQYWEDLDCVPKS